MDWQQVVNFSNEKVCSLLVFWPAAMAGPASSILSLHQLKNQNTMGWFSFVLPEPFDSTYYLAISLFMVIVLYFLLVFIQSGDTVAAEVGLMAARMGPTS